MAYGIWLYKTIETQHGDVTLYIKKRNYTGEAIEINALAPDSLTLSIDGDKLTDPIIGSTLTFGIIDTEQIDTTQFFTPDATLYAVELYRGGTLEWSGYLTPDSYQENLSYRDTISLVARDNLGRLEEFKIEEDQGLQNIEILIDSFLAEVGCPQVLNWQCDKVATEKGEGVEIDTSIRDMWVNTRLWIGKTYRDAVEDILKGLGCQMRFAGNNNLVIVSISDFADFANQSAIFINKSGHKEIIPAWRDATITQDYGLIENFFDGQIKESDMGAKTYFIPYEVANGWYNTSSRGAEMYFANQWMWKNNIEDDQSDSLYPVAKSGGGMASWGVMVNSTNSILTLKMKINNTLRRLANLVFDSTSNLHVGGDNLPSYSLVYQFKIQLKKADGTIYDMTKGGWETSSPSVITFAAEECNYNDEGTWNKDIDVSITINSIPFDGELLIGIGSVMYEGYPDDIVYFGKIKDITLSFNNDIGQKSSRVQIDTKHNINGEVQVNVGQVPRGKGDHLAYAGGLFAADGEPLSFFKRKTNDILAYNLLELVGRENIHLQKRNFVALSGEMTAKDTTITLGANIAYKGKYYALISASLNVLRNTLSVTRMQEVEDYQIAELTIIDSPLESSQGNKVGSGNNEVIQFSNDAGNAKRLYELQDATEQDQDGAYIIIDKSSMDSAKKLPISAISSALNKAFKVHYNSDGSIKSIEALANFWTNFGITAGGEGTGSGGGGGGLTSFSVIVNNKTYNSDNGVATITEQLQPKITAANPLPYALVSGTPTLGSLAYKNSLAASDVPNLSWNKITSDKPTTLAGYGITDAISTSGGTINGFVTVSSGGYLNQMTIDRSNGGISLINFSSAGTWVGSLGCYNNVPIFEDTSQISHTLIHSGNIGSQNVASANSVYSPSGREVVIVNDTSAVEVFGSVAYDTYIDGKTLAFRYGSSYATALTINSSGDCTITGALKLGTKGELWYGSNGEPYFKNLSNSNYINVGGNGLYWNNTDLFLSSANIGYYNAGSATKLATARTIWGQSFDGSANVSGHLTNASSLRFGGDVGLWQGNLLSSLNSDDIGYYATKHAFWGNVLIGTTENTGNKLDVRGKVLIYDSSKTSLDSTVVANSALLHISSMGSANDGLYIGHLVNGTSWLQSAYHGSTSYPSSNHAYPISLNPLGGNVLIGTTTDNGDKLQVNGNLSASGNVISDSYFCMKDSQGSVHTAIDRAGNTLIFGYGFGVKGYDIHYTGYNLHIEAGGGWQTGKNLSLLQNGNVGIGTTSPSYKTDIRNDTWVNYDFHIYNSATESSLYVGYSTLWYGTSLIDTADGIFVVNVGCQYDGGGGSVAMQVRANKNAEFYGNISASGAITAGTASDIRLKDRIQTIDQNKAIEVLMALNPITYQWNDKAKELGGFEGISQGFIAQEYESIIPNSGRAIWGEYRAIDYTKAIPYIVSVEQNHEQRIRQLEEELNRLRREYYGIQ